MKIIKSAKDFELAFCYDRKYLKSTHYPKEYPCILEYVECGGGLMGEYTEHKFIYFPKGCNQKSFLMGYNAFQDIKNEFRIQSV